MASSCLTKSWWTVERRIAASLFGITLAVIVAVIIANWPGVNMSLGKERVRAGFNPSDDQRVESIKSLTAQLIDVCEDLKDTKDGEVKRLCSLAQTAYEEAAMWAVKAATAGK